VASKEEADEMEQRIRLRFNPEEVIRTNVGIVVGSHLGIGGIGVTFFEE
jgi:fatty acid-binding protein DegV